MMGHPGQRPGGRKKDHGSPLCGARQEVGRAGCAKQATGRTATEGCAHIGALTLLQQDQHYDT